MAPTQCSPVKGQRSEVRAYGVAAFPETSLPKLNTPRNDPLSLGPSGLLWETRVGEDRVRICKIE